MDAMQSEDFAWPDVAEVVTFRAQVYEAVSALITRMPPPQESPVTQESAYWALMLAFEHERIHLETSSVLIRQLPVDSVVRGPAWRTAPSFVAAPAQAPVNALVSVAPCNVVLGKPRDFPSFGWDNEYGSRKVAVPAFAASRFLVSNAEFLPFVTAGGYLDRQWWVTAAGDDEGWRWRSYRNATHPSFWVATAHPDMARFVGGRPGAPYQKDDGFAARAGAAPVFRYRTLLEVTEMPWDWPVEVNYLEAAAFLKWKGAQEAAAAAAAGPSSCPRPAPCTYRMLTEAEYHACRALPSPFPEDTAAATAAAPAVATASKGAGDEATHAGAAAAAGGFAHSLLPAPDADERGEALPCADPGSLDLAGRALLPDGTALDASAGSKLVAAVADAPEGRFDIMLRSAGPGNTNFRWHSSTPVNMFPPSPAGFYDVQGNVWQWVEDHFAPLPGFEIHHLYDDFSTPCFDGWHTGILGGSWASTGQLASSYARYHFRRHFFQHLGFRYVAVPAAAPEPYPGAATVSNLWEGKPVTANAVADAYAPAADRLPFPLALAAPEAALAYPAALAGALAAAYTAGLEPAAAAAALACARVLHLGCGVGGGSFALVAAGFGRVVGVDASEPAVRQARLLQHHGQAEYERPTEGVLTASAVARVGAGGAPAQRARVSFLVGDVATDGGGLHVLAADAAGAPFDVVLVDDGLLTRQRQPLALLEALPALLRAPSVACSSSAASPGGLLVLSGANAWDPAVTPRNCWLGGFKMNGEPMSTLAMLQYHLRRLGAAAAPSKAPLELVASRDLARLSRRSARTFDLEVMEVAMFRAGGGASSPPAAAHAAAAAQ